MKLYIVIFSDYLASLKLLQYKALQYKAILPSITKSFPISVLYILTFKRLLSGKAKKLSFCITALKFEIKKLKKFTLNIKFHEQV